MFIKKALQKSRAEEQTTSRDDTIPTTATLKKKQTALTSFFKAPATKHAHDKAATTATSCTNSTSAENTTRASMLHNVCDVRVEKLSFDFADEKKCFEGEGRTISVELDKLIVVGCYVPNSGEGLVRLDYRTKQWYSTWCIHPYTLSTPNLCFALLLALF